MGGSTQPCQVLALQQGLYGKQLLPRLERLVSEDADFAELGAVHHTAETHGLVELARTMGPWDHGTMGPWDDLGRVPHGHKKRVN